MSTIASPLSIAGTRQSGQPVRTQNGKLLTRKRTDAFHKESPPKDKMNKKRCSRHGLIILCWSVTHVSNKDLCD